jgi:hypothetical protein
MSKNGDGIFRQKGYSGKKNLNKKVKGQKV